MKVWIPNRHLIESLVVHNHSMLFKVQERVDAVLKIDKKVGTTTDDGMQVVSEGVAPAPIEEGKEEQEQEVQEPIPLQVESEGGPYKKEADRQKEGWSAGLRI